MDTMADQDMMEDDEIVQEDTWEVIRKYFDENGLVQQQRSSYNEFILQNIQEVSSLPVTGISLLLFTYRITLGKAHCSRGDLTRSEGSGLRELGAHVEGTLCVLAAPALACGCCRKNARRHLFLYCESVSGMALPMFHGAANSLPLQIIDDYKGQIEVKEQRQYMTSRDEGPLKKVQVEFGKVRIAQPSVTEVKDNHKVFEPSLIALQGTAECRLMGSVLRKVLAQH